MRIGNAASADELFDLVLEAAHEAVTYESASLMTVDAAGDALIIRAARPGRLVGTRVGVGPSISWQALERREPLIIEGPAPKELGTPYTKDVPFAICIPLLVAAKTQGILNVNRQASMEWVGSHKAEFTGAMQAAVGARIVQHMMEKGADNIRPEIVEMITGAKTPAAE